ncbi:ribosomal protein S18-alanine N-acetyltransferase [Leucobacter sp. NPDC077196]|uniref:ribosomal protein S18-alanine N-acetyltransferase n=1 Tax=Leucobacter sp. NPDC077196 TaxID=3154959 RepID=UPI00343ADE07
MSDGTVSESAHAVPTGSAAPAAPAAPADHAAPSARRATLDDLDAVWALEASVFGAEAWSLSMMREELVGDHRDYFVLAGSNGDVLGYGGLLAVGTDADIQTIAVHPSLRGMGQGRRLMTLLLDSAEARGVREVFLEVRADNAVAHRLYTTLGFAEIGVRPRYYQPEGVDAIVMRLEVRARNSAATALEDQA